MHRTGYWLLARLEFLVKQPLGPHERRGVVLLCIAAAPLSLSSPPPPQQPIQDPRWQGASWAMYFFDLFERGPARVRGLVLKRTAMGNFFVFYCAKPRTGKCCQRPSHQRSSRTSKRYAIKITPHTARACALVVSYFYFSRPPQLPVPPRLISLLCRSRRGRS